VTGTPPPSDFPDHANSLSTVSGLFRRGTMSSFSPSFDPTWLGRPACCIPANLGGTAVTARRGLQLRSAAASPWTAIGNAYLSGGRNEIRYCRGQCYQGKIPAWAPNAWLRGVGGPRRTPNCGFRLCLNYATYFGGSVRTWLLESLWIQPPMPMRWSTTSGELQSQRTRHDSSLSGVSGYTAESPQTSSFFLVQQKTASDPLCQIRPADHQREPSPGDVTLIYFSYLGGVEMMPGLAICGKTRPEGGTKLRV